MTPEAPFPAVLNQAIRACRAHLAGAVVFSALLNLLFLAPTLYMMQVYDRVVPTGGRDTLLFLTLVLALALATLAALDAVRMRLLVLAGLRLDRWLAEPLLQAQVAAGGRTRSREALRQFDVLRQTLAGPAMLAALDAPWAPVYLIVAFLIHPALGLFSIAAAVVLVVLAVLNERDGRVRGPQVQRAQQAAYAIQEAASTHAEAIRALGMQKALRSRHLEGRKAGMILSAEGQVAGGRFTATTKFARMLFQSGALGLGALLAIEHQISGGAIIAASVLLSRALQPVEQLVGAWGSVTQARTAWSDVKSLLSDLETPRTHTTLAEPEGRLSLVDILYRAAPGAPVVLRGVTLDVAPGEILGVAGPSGAGKSTLARIASGALTASAGELRLDGAAFRDWESDSRGRYIGYLPQTPQLLPGSVRDNISRFVGNDTVDKAVVDRDVLAAAHAAGVNDLILRLPKGYDTDLSGHALSAGQTQRVALARALFRSPPLLVLDEPNASLDQEGENALITALTAARERGAGILLVAHRGSVLAIADRLLILRDGRVEIAGPRDMILGAIGLGQAVGPNLGRAA